MRASRAAGVSVGPLMGAVVTADKSPFASGPAARSVDVATNLQRRAEDAHDDTGRDSDENTGWGAVEVNVREMPEQQSEQHAHGVGHAEAEQADAGQLTSRRRLRIGHRSPRLARSKGMLLATRTTAATPPAMASAGSGPPVIDMAT